MLILESGRYKQAFFKAIPFLSFSLPAVEEFVQIGIIIITEQGVIQFIVLLILIFILILINLLRLASLDYYILLLHLPGWVDSHNLANCLFQWLLSHLLVLSTQEMCLQLIHWLEEAFEPKQRGTV